MVTGGVVDLVPALAVMLGANVGTTLVESTSLDLDILRELKRIHSHRCSAAYPVFERAAALQASRLREGTLARPAAAARRALRRSRKGAPPRES
ncbi:MAG TPA: hypothetical protein VMT92_12005 [Steroidobacteraceae bacterium]|nr:hypothetical protein [Steroidobacteraceae bacterium]